MGKIKREDFSTVPIYDHEIPDPSSSEDERETKKAEVPKNQ